MQFKYKVLLLSCCLLMYSSCGKDTTDPQGHKIARTSDYINKGEYKSAINTLESESIRSLVRNEGLRILIDAYLGFCKMDAKNLYYQSQTIKEETNKQSLNDYEKIKVAISKIYKRQKKCQYYINRSIFLIENFSIKKSFSNIHQQELYEGNLYLIDSIYLIQDLYSNVNEEDDLKDIVLVKQIKIIYEIIKNLKLVISHYKKSYEKMSFMFNFIERAYIFKKEAIE